MTELLVQMDAFEGIFVCATNLPDVFDPASTRRFELKVRFNPVRSDQRERLFVTTLRQLGSPECEASSDVGQATAWSTALTKLDGLTAGDHASVARRLRLLGVQVDATRLLLELEDEHPLK